jgi:glycosyltransferase involved in cell wall biosynthesis
VPGPFAEAVGGPHFALPLVERRSRRLPRAAWALRAAVRGWRPDVVHAHNPTMGLLAAAATRRGSGRPALVSVHGVPDEDYRRAARILRLAGVHVVACGTGVASGLAEHGLDAETIVNGIAPAPAPADRAALEREWGLPPGAPLLVAAGRLVPQKNHDLALRALAGVADARLAVLGEGPLAEELERTGGELGLGDRLVIAGLRPDARAIIAAGDAVVITSHAEGLPLVALESLAAGTPIVATAVRGIRELLEHERTALLTPPDDAQALAEALRRILTEPELRERLSGAGRELAADYTEDAMVTRYLELYARLTG